MHIKYLFALMLAFGTPVLADQTKATIEDIYVDRIYPLCQGSCPLLYFSLIFRWAG